MGLGRHIYAAGVLLLGIIGLVSRDFVLGQPVPRNFPHRVGLALAAGVFLAVAAAAVEWGRAAMWGSAALTAYYVLVVAVVLNGRLVLTHYAAFGTYSEIAEQLSIGLGSLMIYARYARMHAAGAARLTRTGQVTFGVCALLFGGAHFVYMNLTAPLVPGWLPPSQLFWGYATGVGFVAAGMALITGIQARLAAILLTAMLVSFALLVHWPMLIADHSSKMNWTEGAINLTIIGTAWLVAESFSRPRQIIATS